MSTVSLSVPGAHCGTCRAVVLHTLRTLPGVQQAELDLRDRHATVRFDAAVLDVAALCAALGEAGYPATPADVATAQPGPKPPPTASRHGGAVPPTPTC